MYDSSRIKNNKPITLDYILSKVSEQDIYTHYIGEFKVGMIYNSPFRKDKNPSFGIFYSKKSNKLLFKDHGTGICGDIIKFVSLYTGLTNYDAILNNIVESLKITKKTKLSNESNYYQSSETVIGVVRQPFTDKDLLYWKQYAISKTTLNKYDVHSIKYYLCNGYVKGIYKDENPMYAYKVYNHFKIYRPKGDKFTKWRNNLTEFDIQGLELDWCLVGWDADYRYVDGKFEHWKFTGTTWKQRQQDIQKRYLENAYRVLLTRARQGMVIFMPVGNEDDNTRLPKFYNDTFDYLVSCGAEVLN